MIKKEGLMEQLLKKQKYKGLKKGDEIEAAVILPSKKGVFFDIGTKAYAVLGRLEQKELNLYRSFLQPGQKIKVIVVTPESKEGYPVVSLRNFFRKGKWEILKEKQQKEEEIEVVCGEYGKGGVFVDFLGIRGVIPKIQLTDEYIHQPEKLQGQKIKVKILEVDEEKNRLVVSQKAAALKISQKELKERFDKIKVGEKYRARVISVSEFGAFCEVNGVEGLIHISEISWEKVTNPTLYIKPGQIVDVIVVEKNDKDFKLNLSLKRLTQDPWIDIDKKYPKDKEIEGVVVRKERYGYFVKLEPGIEGLIHASKLKNDEKIEIGKKIKVYIERINTKTRRISLILPQKEIPITYR
jgi:ribosomal protein S1